MKQPEDTKTAELPGLTRRGRPPVGDKAMTPAERQKAYRERKKEETWFATTDESSRVALLSKLAHHLRAVDEDHELKAGAQHLAEEVIAEIVTRYGLRKKRVNTLISRAAAARSK